MKRAGFRLDSILRLRDRELSTARGVLASHLRGQRKEADERERWLKHVGEGARTLSTRLEAGIRAGAAQATSYAIDASRACAQAADLRLRAYDDPIAAARHEVTEARRRVRALEILRTRFRKKEREHEAKRSQRDLDEIGSRAASRERQA